MTLEDAKRRARHYDEAAKLGRTTAWERALDDVDDEALKPAPDCFACEHLRAGDACGLVARLAMGRRTRRDAAKIVDLVEYRAIGQHDPQALCPGFGLAASVRWHGPRPLLPPFDGDDDGNAR